MQFRLLVYIFKAYWFSFCLVLIWFFSYFKCIFMLWLWTVWLKCTKLHMYVHVSWRQIFQTPNNFGAQKTQNISFKIHLDPFFIKKNFLGWNEQWIESNQSCNHKWFFHLILQNYIWSFISKNFFYFQPFLQHQKRQRLVRHKNFTQPWWNKLGGIFLSER